MDATEEGTFLTSLSLNEPELDLDPVQVPEEAGEGEVEKDEVEKFLDAQVRRRKELEGYVNKLQASKDADGDEPLVRFPDNFSERVQKLVSTSVSKKRDFLQDLKKLTASQLAAQYTREHGESGEEKPWETDAKISSGINKIKELDQQLQGVEDKLKILSQELKDQAAATQREEKKGKGKNENKDEESGQMDKRTSAVDAFMKARKLKRVLNAEGLTEHMKRNAALGPDSRYFTLSEEDAKLVEEVMNRNEDNEEDPYEFALEGFLGSREEEEEEEEKEGEEGGRDETSKRLSEIDKKLEEYSTSGSIPSTPMSLRCDKLASASSRGSLGDDPSTDKSSPDSVILSGRSRAAREAQALKELLRMERDVDAKIVELRQSELPMVQKEEIDLLLQNFYSTSVPNLVLSSE